MPNPNLSEEFLRLVKIVQTLRGSHGCEWDRAQTHQSLIPYLLEEAYEVIESIDEGNPEKLKEELGDLLLHIVFQASLAEDQQKFQLQDSIRNISDKLVRRHPHVFGDVTVKNVAEIKQNWEEIKLKEGRKSLMDGLPKTLPALLQAQRVQLRASEVGFDWDEIGDVWAKVHEEIDELKEAVESENHEAIRDEFGDLLFSLVNLSRFLNVNTEESLRHTIKKFVRRFRSVEEQLQQRGKSFRESNLSEMDSLWDNCKAAEKQDNPASTD